MTALISANVVLRDPDLAGADRADAAIRDTVVENPNLATAMLQPARGGLHGHARGVVRFHDCDLRGARFLHAAFANSAFRRCRMDDIGGVEGLRGTSMQLSNC